MNPRETFGWEENMRPYMDRFYESVYGVIPDRTKNCRQYDLLVGDRMIEEKFLFSGVEYDQFLVELLQDAKTGNLGWFYTESPDILAWVYCQRDHISPPDYIYLIEYEGLKKYVYELLEEEVKWRNFNICNLHYGITINLPIKWDPLLISGIAKRCKYNM